MFTLIGFYESQDGGAAVHKVAAIQDEHVRAEGDYVYVPRGMGNVIGKAVLSAADVALTSARFVSPSMLAVAYCEVRPLINAVVFGSPPENILHPLSPMPLKEDEGFSLEINSDGSAAVVEYGLAWFADGPQQAITGQKVYPVRATSAITLTAGKWANGNLTFSEQLPVGEFEIIGLRAEGANLVAARLVIPGTSVRPGVAAVNAIGDLDHAKSRYGAMGSFGRFHSLSPPTIDVLGVTDTSQTYILDLVKVS